MSENETRMRNTDKELTGLRREMNDRDALTTVAHILAFNVAGDIQTATQELDRGTGGRQRAMEYLRRATVWSIAIERLTEVRGEAPEPQGA